MRCVEPRFKETLDIHWEEIIRAAPGLVVQVAVGENRVIDLEWGKTYPYYDLASLTKVIFTSTATISLLSRMGRRWQSYLRQPIHEILEWWPHGATTPQSLFTHTAGLEWWLPMYKRLRGPVKPEFRWPQLPEKLAKVRPRRRHSAIYSDLDLWLLGFWLEQMYEQSLLDIWMEHVEKWKINSAKIFFHPANKRKYKKSTYAPTERCPWRKRVLQGEVHDENAWSFGGVAPHAGLFGTADEVMNWALRLRKAYLHDTSYVDSKVTRYFVNRRVPRAIGDWGLGFMKPSKGKASCGKYFSQHSFGHTGFTGTSYWYDPRRDLSVVILSNRVHPTRKNNAFVALRPQLHNWIVKAIEN